MIIDKYPITQKINITLVYIFDRLSLFRHEILSNIDTLTYF